MPGPVSLRSLKIELLRTSGPNPVGDNEARLAGVLAHASKITGLPRDNFKIYEILLFQILAQLFGNLAKFCSIFESPYRPSIGSGN
jgi:hypothetical protein